MDSTNIIIVPETHWDREWYLTFQEYRAKLVLLMDKLLNILKNDVQFKNFTLDGQTIPIEDYLEVRPEREDEIKKYVKEGRLSIGPMYILPDEFLISGESLIRNLMIGHQIARRFGRIMKAGYTPDTFGHFAQIPQILSGCEIPSVIFARGFGNEFEENNLDMEFTWKAPGNAASVLGIFLIMGYGSVARLNTNLEDGKYKAALNTLNSVVSAIEKHTATPYLLLNNGEDHLEAQPEIPLIIKQWNEEHPNKIMEQNDFEFYVKMVLEHDPKLNEFQGELRGGRYLPLLSGVFSTRMWIKQRNTEIEYLFEKYTEPLATITWALDKKRQFDYPGGYILTGLKWLIKNHPHDSICGCSIDQVHDEMKTRFDWAEQIGSEVIKNTIFSLCQNIKFNSEENSQIPLIIYNPLPWVRIDKVEFNVTATSKRNLRGFPKKFKIQNSGGEIIEYQQIPSQIEPRFKNENTLSNKVTFLAEVPACGYNTYYLKVEKEIKDIEQVDLKISKQEIENEYYKVSVSTEGQINLYDKTSGISYQNICEFKDVGDWGDEYDYSGPRRKQLDTEFYTRDAKIIDISLIMDGPIQKTLKITLNLNLPKSLSIDRLKRTEDLVDNEITIHISLLKGIKKIDFKINFNNKSKDHRIQILFPSKIITDKVYCDGHFQVITRDIELPDGKKWAQKPLPTNHQKDFISINDSTNCFTILNKGLPEYEAIKNEDGTISLTITLLRCIEWLSRSSLTSRRADAGPPLNTPGAQCIGNHSFEISLITSSDNSDWLNSEAYLKGKEFNNPLKAIFPSMVNSNYRNSDSINLSQHGTIESKNPKLPEKLSFLEIDNNKILLSILKKSEEGDYLIVRLYNISSETQKGNLTFFEKIIIKNVEIVNLLEEKPKNLIKSNIEGYDKNLVSFTLEANVIATIKLEI